MKLNNVQLKRLIAEEAASLKKRNLSEAIQGRHPGAPLFEAPMPDTDDRGVASGIDGVVAAWEDNMLDMFDDNDPSMAHVGLSGWQKQVTSVSGKLRDALERVISDHESMLFSGEGMF